MVVIGVDMSFDFVEMVVGCVLFGFNMVYLSDVYLVVILMKLRFMLVFVIIIMKIVSGLWLFWR